MLHHVVYQMVFRITPKRLNTVNVLRSTSKLICLLNANRIPKSSLKTSPPFTQIPTPFSGCLIPPLLAAPTIFDMMPPVYFLTSFNQKATK